MPLTYDPIATTTLGSSTSTVTFSSVPNTFTDIVLVISGTTGGNDTVGLRFNGDSGSNYSYTLLFGDGSSAGSTRGTNETFSRLGAIYSSQTTILANIMSYSNTNVNKTILSRGNNAGNQTNAFVTLWRNTAAISSITVNAIFGSFNSGSTFTLYGIKAA